MKKGIYYYCHQHQGFYGRDFSGDSFRGSLSVGAMKNYRKGGLKTCAKCNREAIKHK